MPLRFQPLAATQHSCWSENRSTVAVIPDHRPPRPSSESASRRMHNTRQRDTPMERRVRHLLLERSLSFEVDRSIPGVTRSRPDIAFTKERIAVYLDGCFWHSCPIHGTTPRANRSWWLEKLAANVERDRRHNRELRTSGWLVLRFWEHEDPRIVADAIESRVYERRMLTQVKASRG